MNQTIINKICLGTGDLLKGDIKERIDVFKKFYLDGGRLIDTARIYHNGKSLKIIKKLNLKFNIIAKPSYFIKDDKIPLKKNLTSIKNYLVIKQLITLLLIGQMKQFQKKKWII